MEISALLNQAFGIMLTGMIVVFCFLTLLIGIVTLMSRLANNFSESNEVQEKARSQNSGAHPVPKAHIAAISAAIFKFKAENSSAATSQVRQGV